MATKTSNSEPRKRGRRAVVKPYEAIADCMRAIDALRNTEEKERVLLALIAYVHGEDWSGPPRLVRKLPELKLDAGPRE